MEEKLASASRFLAEAKPVIREVSSKEYGKSEAV